MGRTCLMMGLIDRGPGQRELARRQQQSYSHVIVLHVSIISG